MTDRDHESHGRAFTRRQTLGMAGAAGGALALGGVAGKAISELGGSDEVPFYVDLDKVRRDITEGRPVPLQLKIRVIDVRKCKPIHSAAVDIWHCDAGGLYSDESSNGTAGQTFLRGVQLTDKKGYATTQTVYSGHYTGRATHIHLKVHIGRQGPRRDLPRRARLAHRTAVLRRVFELQRLFGGPLQLRHGSPHPQLVGRHLLAGGGLERPGPPDGQPERRLRRAGRGRGQPQAHPGGRLTRSVRTESVQSGSHACQSGMMGPG
jgi:hypothetical protein